MSSQSMPTEFDVRIIQMDDAAVVQSNDFHL